MKKTIGIAFAVSMALVLALMAVPAMAHDVATNVDVQGGATNPPIVKCKWEQDLTSSLENGDVSHASNGSQFLPPLAYQGKKVVQYWAVVTDPEGVNTVEQVTVDVYHPTQTPECGSFKYQLILTEVDKVESGIPAYEAARDAGLVTYQQEYTDAEVTEELVKCTAKVYMVEGFLDYHQPAGDYLAIYDAYDGGRWASEEGYDLENFFTYIAVCAIEIDFTAVNYGTVEVCNNKWIAGDTVFGSTPATVRNIGNTDASITLVQDDMGFGYSGIQPNIDWNVEFDARLGNDTANEKVYDPHEQVKLPNVLPLCNTEEMDFSIHIKKSTSQVRTGTMTLGCEIAPFPPCNG